MRDQTSHPAPACQFLVNTAPTIVISMPDAPSHAASRPTDLRVVHDLDTLFRLHYGRLVCALTVAGGDREAAADAVQEAFVKAHLRWRKLERYDDPVGWIRRVAINQLRDGHRRRGRKERADERMGSAASTAAATPTPDQYNDVQMGNDDTMAMLRQLPRQQRLSIALFYVDELSIAEIAEALEISAGAVKFHLHQGRERLRSGHPGHPDHTGHPGHPTPGADR